MADGTTNNRNLTLPTVGGDSGTWGTVVNNGVMTQLDLILGNTQAITITSADVALTTAQFQNAAIKLTGALTGNHNLTVPLSTNSATAACGGYFVVDNETSGAFNVTVLTAASGSVGVKVPQGVRSWLYSDQTNVLFADDAAIHIPTVSGNPSGQLAGSAASVNNPPTLAYDYTNNALYACTTTGNSASAVFTNLNTLGASLPIPEGYLTPVSATPIITSDSVSATVVYYTPFMGTWAAIHNGSNIIPYQFSQLSLTLTSSQAANNIYDIFLAYNGGTPVIGTGPSWSAGTGGSVTLGSCARGTGAGGTSLARLQGLWTNNVQISLIYNTGSGNTTITVPVNQGIYLGSIYIDSVAGQVSCYRSFGSARKFGIYNPYQRQPVVLQAGDSTASWSYLAATIRASNGSSNNYADLFVGLQDQIINVMFEQNINTDANASVAINSAFIGIGVNVTNAFSGRQGQVGGRAGSSPAGQSESVIARYVTATPILGASRMQALEQSNTNFSAATFFGTSSNMLLSATWQG